MLIVSKCDTINAALFYLCKVVEGNMSRTLYVSAADELLRGEGDPQAR